MEAMVGRMPSDAFWRNRRVLVTGHTGFKGAWLAMWLQKLGSHVAGISLPPHTDPSLFAILAPWASLDDHRTDVTEAVPLTQAVASIRPQVVIHMAAQALVPAAAKDPVTTFHTNVLGTVNLLAACLAQAGLQAVLIITTDKVYANGGSGKPFVEGDPLGGCEPYGSSKAAAELAVDAYRPMFEDRGIGLATARAGNVLGGGDWSTGRLVPDVVRAIDAGRQVVLRDPTGVRPWQHVFDPLAGYLLYAELLVTDRGRAPPSLNFGPSEQSYYPVAEVVDRVARACGASQGVWTQCNAERYREARALRLSAAKAQASLVWRPRLDFDRTVRWAADWYVARRAGHDMRRYSLDQLEKFCAMETLL